MHFLRAVILSIAALALTATASPVSCSGGCNPECLDDGDCGKDCYCIGGVRNRGVSSLLLLAPSELNCNHFTDLWILRKGYWIQL